MLWVLHCKAGAVSTGPKLQLQLQAALRLLTGNSAQGALPRMSSSTRLLPQSCALPGRTCG